MQTMTIVNPSRKLQALITILNKGYEQTCHTDNCNCMSHDSGYDWVEAEVSDEVAARIRKTPGNPSSHPCSWLEEEGWPKGLPTNAPDWARTSSKIRYECGYCHGTQPRVETDGDFTVVKLLEGKNSCVRMCGWEVEKEIFATKDGVGDHTAEYKKFRFLRRKTQDVARFEEAGLTNQEAHRLFGVGKEQWSREFEPRIFGFAAEFRGANVPLLAELARTISGRRQENLARSAGLTEAVNGLSCPRTEALASRALWVFHGKKPEDVPAPETPVRPFPTVGTGWRLVSA